MYSRAAHHAVALLRLALSHLQVRLKLHPRTHISELFRRAATLAPLVPASALGRLRPFSVQSETPPQNEVRTLVVRLAAHWATSKDAFLLQQCAAVFCGRWMRDVPCEARKHLANRCTTFDLVSAERILEERCLRPPSRRFITRSVMMSTWSSDRTRPLQKGLPSALPASGGGTTGNLSTTHT